MDAIENFAFSTVLAAPTPPATGLTLTPQAADVGEFPAPPFTVVAYPPGVRRPLRSNAELVRVTAENAGVWTIEREQEGTTAKTIGAGWIVAQVITKQMLEDMRDLLPVAITDTHVYFNAETPGRYLKIAGANVGTLPP
jgi:hypothetical protein